MDEWNIQSRARECCVTGKPFEEGEIIISMLFLGKGGYERQDMSQQAWRERDNTRVPVSYWQTRYIAPPPPAPEPLKKDDAEKLLRRLLDENDTATLNTRYILALMMERKRLFKQIDTFRNDFLGKVIVYEHLKTGESFTIQDPELRLDEMEPIQREVADMLAGKTAAPAAAEPDPVAETPVQAPDPQPSQPVQE